MVEGINSIRIIPRKSRLPRTARVFVRNQDIPVVRDHRRDAPEFGEDPLEARAISPDVFARATLPERIVYKKLSQLIGEENFIFQYSQLGGRNLIGGFLIDFLIEPNIALEVLGSYWHKAFERWADEERAVVVASRGFEYHEIWDWEIYMGDSYLEEWFRRVLPASVFLQP